VSFDFGFLVLDFGFVGKCEIDKFAALFDLEDIFGFYTAPAKCVRTRGHPSEARKYSILPVRAVGQTADTFKKRKEGPQRKKTRFTLLLWFVFFVDKTRR